MLRLCLGLGLRYDRTLAQLGELCLERLELLLRRIESIEDTAGSRSIGELGQYFGRVGRDQVILNVRADAREMNAADLRVARKRQCRGSQFELGLGQRVGCRSRFEIRSRIVARIEANRIGLRQIGDRSLGAIIAGIVAHPERRVIARTVECLDAGAIGLVADKALELLAADKFAQLVGRRRCLRSQRVPRLWPAPRQELLQSAWARPW